MDAFGIANARANVELGREAPDVVDALRATVLVIDDLGAEDPRALRSAIPDVLHKRHRDPRLTTIVTTGLGESELGKLYGGGLVRRLFEGAVLIAPGERQ